MTFHDLSEDELDALLDDAEDVLDALPPGTEAQGLDAAARSMAPGEAPRAELLRLAVDYWMRADDHAAAIASAEEAIADGGPTWIDARTDLVRVLLELGDPRVDGLLKDLRRDLARVANPDAMLELLADDLHDAGRYREAVRFYNLVLDAVAPEELTDGHHLLGAAGRRRVARAALGRPRDRFDIAAEQHGLESAPDDWSFGDRSTLLYWPSEELAEVLQRWPDLEPTYVGADPRGHRAQVERALLRQAATIEGAQAVAAGRLADLLSYAARRGLDARHGAARRGYVSSLEADGHAVVWPPASDEACWCGSGTAYAECCDAISS